MEEKPLGEVMAANECVAHVLGLNRKRFLRLDNILQWDLKKCTVHGKWQQFNNFDTEMDKAGTALILSACINIFYSYRITDTTTVSHLCESSGESPVQNYHN